MATGYNNQIADIKRTLYLSVVVSEVVKLKRVGNGKMSGCCPFHKEKTASFYVNDIDGFYKCFGCGESGDIFTFTQKVHRLDFPEALKMLADKAGIVLEAPKKEDIIQKQQIEQSRGILEFSTDYFYQKLPTTKKAIDYITEKRKLTKDTIEFFKIGYAPSGGRLCEILLNSGYSKNDIYNSGMVSSINNKVDFFEDRIVIPILDISGKIVGFGGRIIEDRDGVAKYINSRDSALFKKSNLLFNHRVARDEVVKNKKHFIVVEGYMDVIAMHQCGFKHCVAPLGTSITEAQIEILLKVDKDIVICMDNDDAGKNAAIKIAKILLKTIKAGNAPKFVTLNKAKDLDEVINSSDSPAEAAFAIDLMIDSSMELQDFLWHTLSAKFNLSNANEIALFSKTLKEYYETITDRELKDFYTAELDKRIYYLKRNLGKLDGRIKSVTKTIFAKNVNRLASSVTGKQADAGKGKINGQDPEFKTIEDKEMFLCFLMLKHPILLFGQDIGVLLDIDLADVLMFHTALYEYIICTILDSNKDIANDALHAEEDTEAKIKIETQLTNYNSKLAIEIVFKALPPDLIKKFKKFLIKFEQSNLKQFYELSFEKFFKYYTAYIKQDIIFAKIKSFNQNTTMTLETKKKEFDNLKKEMTDIGKYIESFGGDS